MNKSVIRKHIINTLCVLTPVLLGIFIGVILSDIFNEFYVGLISLISAFTLGLILYLLERKGGKN